MKNKEKKLKLNKQSGLKTGERRARGGGGRIETERHETKLNETERSQAKRNQENQNQTKRNQTDSDKTGWNGREQDKLK